MLSDFAEERKNEGNGLTSHLCTTSDATRCSALGAACLHGVLQLMCCAVRKQNPAANVSLIKRAHIFSDANGGILPNKAKRRGISPRRDVAFVLAESEPGGRVFCDKRRI